MVVACVGAFTAIFAATIGIAQNDIKRMLAYSTISQLGYMMMALGIGTAAAYAAGMFHLFTHAFFKALLFLGCRQRHPCDTYAGYPRDGRLRQDDENDDVDVCHRSAGAGRSVPLFAVSGRKDAILTEAYDHHPALFGVGLIAAFLHRVLHVARLFFLVFAGEKRSEYKAQENNGWMTVPLVILAVLAVVLASCICRTPWLGEWLTGALMADHTSWLVIVLSNIVAIAGLLLGWTMYGKKPIPADDLVSAGVPQLNRSLI